MVIFWGGTPGKRPLVLPEDMAFTLRPGDDLVIQAHMTPTGKPESVQPKLGFTWTDRAPARFPLSLLLVREDIDIPADDAGHVVTESFTLPAAATLTSLYPHAHYLCASMRVELTAASGKTDVLLDLPAWDFDWQDEYRLATPRLLAAGTTVGFRYVFDNSAANPRNPNQPPQRVRYGLRSVDEMASLMLQLLPQDDSARWRIEEAIHRHKAAQVPGDPDAWNDLALALMKQQRWSDAQAAIDAALEQQPNHREALLNQGLIASASGDQDAAMRSFARCVKEHPKFVAGYVRLADALIGRSQPARAAASLRSALVASPERVDVRNRLGVLLAQNGRFEDALIEQRLVADALPKDLRAQTNFATTLLQLGQFEAAAKRFRRALQLDADDFTARFLLGRCLLGVGDRAAALIELRLAEALRPDDAALKDSLRQAGG